MDASMIWRKISLSALDKGKRNRNQKIYCLVMALIFTDTILYGIIVPLIPIYMKDFHLTTLSIGIIFSAYSFGVLILSLPFGMMGEKYGYRKIFLVGMSALAVSCLCYGLVTNVWMLFLCRFCQGAAAAASWTAGLAVVAVLFPDQQGQKIGFLMAVIGLGTIFGPPIGGILYHFFGYHQMFIFLSFLCLLLIYFIFQSDFTGLTGNKAPERAINFSLVCKNSSGLLWLSVIVVVLASIFGMLEILMPAHMDQHFGLDTLQIGLFFGFMGIVHSVSDALAGHLSDHYGYEIFIFGGLLMNALCFPLLAFAPSVGFLLLIMSLVGIATGAAVTTSQPMMYRVATSGTGQNGGAGFIYGFYNTCYSIGMFLGPLLGGLLNRYFNLLTGLTSFSFLFLLSALLFQSKIIKGKRNTSGSRDQERKM